MVSKDLTNDKTSGETETGADLLEAVDTAILAIQEQLKSTGCEKGSLTDLVRLLQLRRDLEGDRPRRVSARWIDECKTLND